MPGIDAIEQLRARGRAAGLAGLIVLSPVNLRYLTGFYSSAYSRPLGLVIPTAGEPVLLVPHLEAEQARHMTRHVEVRDFIEWEQGSRAGGTLVAEWQALLLEVLRERGIAGEQLGVERAALNVERDQTLRAALPGPEPLDISGWVEALRLIKTPEEVEDHRRGAVLAAAGLDACFKAARAGLTELEIFGEADRAAAAVASREFPDRPIAIGGKAVVGVRIGAIHSPSIGVPAKPGDPVFAVMVVSVGGSWCELSRTFVVGARPTEEQERIHRAVEEAHEVALAAAMPGRPARDVDLAARAALAKVGLDQYLPMRTGHGIGFAPVEAPNLGASDPTPLAAGMVVSIEPGVCIPGVGGALWADNYLITDRGPEPITNYPLRADAER